MYEYFSLAYQLVQNKYDKEDKLFPIFVLAFTVLLEKYKNYQDIVINLFLETRFYIEEATVLDIMNKYGVDDYETILGGDYEDRFGDSFGGIDVGFVNNKLVLHKDLPIIIISDVLNSNELLLNMLIHEFNHLINGYLNNYEYSENGKETTIIIRSGISLYSYTYDEELDELEEVSYFSILDEVINVFQTTELMKEILELGSIVDDTYILDFINALDKETMLLDNGYEGITAKVKDLWKNMGFKTLVEDNIVSGNVENIISSFDEVLGVGSFQLLADTIDELYDIYYNGADNNNKQALKHRLKTLINDYNKNNPKVYKK